MFLPCSNPELAIVWLLSWFPVCLTKNSRQIDVTQNDNAKKAEIAGLLVQREPLACTCIVLRADTPCAKKLAIKGKKANVPDNYLIPFYNNPRKREKKVYGIKPKFCRVHHHKVALLFMLNNKFTTYEEGTTHFNTFEIYC